MANAQIDFGLKGGINYNSDSFRVVSNDILKAGAQSKTGFHAGVWTRFKLPLIGLYLRPELVYTSLKSDVTFTASAFGLSQSKNAAYNFQKIDLPVLIGKKFLGVATAFIGPSFQYIIDGDLSIDNVKDVDANGITVGVQAGLGVELGKIGLDVRWERGFSDLESNLIGDAGDKFNFDTRVNQIIVGLSIKL